MERIKRRIVVLSLTVLLTAFSVGAVPAGASAAQAQFNNEYLYATTRGVSDLNMHPGLKLTLYPVTLVLDTALLPFAVIAGFVTT